MKISDLPRSHHSRPLFLPLHHNIPLSVLGQDNVLFLILPDSPPCALSSPSCYLFIAKSGSFMDRDCLSLHPTPTPNASLNWISQKNRIQPTFQGSCATEQWFSNSLISGCFTLFEIIEDSIKLQSKQTNKSISLYLQTSLMSGLREDNRILKFASAFDSL